MSGGALSLIKLYRYVMKISVENLAEKKDCHGCEGKCNDTFVGSEFDRK